VLEAFLRAARPGDLAGLIELLAPDVILRSNELAIASLDAPARLDGAEAVAGFFSGRAQTARTALINGELSVVVPLEPPDRLVLVVTVEKGAISRIDAVADSVATGSTGPNCSTPTTGARDENRRTAPSAPT
jgi:RNA polymerase sigma-70 factor, ECF subfamily